MIIRKTMKLLRKLSEPVFIQAERYQIVLLRIQKYQNQVIMKITMIMIIRKTLLAIMTTTILIMITILKKEKMIIQIMAMTIIQQRIIKKIQKNQKHQQIKRKKRMKTLFLVHLHPKKQNKSSKLFF